MSDERAKAIQRLEKEKKLIASKPVEGVRFEPGDESSPTVWTIFVNAPPEYVVGTERRPSPYSGRTFPVKVTFPDNYPFKHPEMLFPAGMLYHPQVDKTGAICSEDFGKSFGPTKNVTDIAKFVITLLAQPNIDTSPEVDIMQEMRSNISAFEDKARRAAEKAPKI